MYGVVMRVRKEVNKMPRQIGYVPSTGQTIADALRGFLEKFRTREKEAEERRLKMALMGMPTTYQEAPSTLRSVLGGIPKEEYLTPEKVEKAVGYEPLPGTTLAEGLIGYGKRPHQMTTFGEKQRAAEMAELKLRADYTKTIQAKEIADKKVRESGKKIIIGGLSRKYQGDIASATGNLMYDGKQIIEGLKGISAAMQADIEGKQTQLTPQKIQLDEKIKKLEEEYQKNLAEGEGVSVWEKLLTKLFSK